MWYSPGLPNQRYNIFHATRGHYFGSLAFDRAKALASANHNVEITEDAPGLLSYTLNTDAPDFDDIIPERKRTQYTPDEVLASNQPLKLRIPVVSREDMEANGTPLPSLGLLEALHYYVGYHSTVSTQLLDELALLTMGMLVENLVDQMVTETFAETCREDSLLDETSYDTQVVEMLDKDQVLDEDGDEPISKIDMGDFLNSSDELHTSENEPEDDEGDEDDEENISGIRSVVAKPEPRTKRRKKTKTTKKKTERRTGGF